MRASASHLGSTSSPGKVQGRYREGTGKVQGRYGPRRAIWEAPAHPALLAVGRAVPAGNRARRLERRGCPALGTSRRRSSRWRRGHGRRGRQWRRLRLLALDEVERGARFRGRRLIRGGRARGRARGGAWRPCDAREVPAVVSNTLPFYSRATGAFYPATQSNSVKAPPPCVVPGDLREKVLAADGGGSSGPFSPNANGSSARLAGRGGGAGASTCGFSATFSAGLDEGRCRRGSPLRAKVKGFLTRAAAGREGPSPPSSASGEGAAAAEGGGAAFSLAAGSPPAATVPFLDVAFFTTFFLEAAFGCGSGCGSGSARPTDIGCALASATGSGSTYWNSARRQE